MNEQERELDLMVAELEQENRLLRARNERLEREALAVKPVEAPSQYGSPELQEMIVARAVEKKADALIRKYINALVENKPDEANNATKAMVDYVYGVKE